MICGQNYWKIPSIFFSKVEDWRPTKNVLLYWSFSRKIHIHIENLSNSHFNQSEFASNFLNRCFSELFKLGACKISQQGYWFLFRFRKHACCKKLIKLINEN